MPGRKPLDIDLELLQKIISEIEAGDSPPKTRTELWKAVAARYPIKVSPQTLMMKAEKNNFSIATPKGIRGTSLTEARASIKNKRRPRKFLKGAEPEVREKFERLGENTVEKLLAGNLKAAVKAFCWDCMGESKKEVSLCASYSCPMWPHRPWQQQASPVEEKKLFPLEVVSDAGN